MFTTLPGYHCGGWIWDMDDAFIALPERQRRVHCGYGQSLQDRSGNRERGIAQADVDERGRFPLGLDEADGSKVVWVVDRQRSACREGRRGSGSIPSHAGGWFSGLWYAIQAHSLAAWQHGERVNI